MGALILEFGELIEMAKKKIKITFFENIFKKTNYFTICLQLLDKILTAISGIGKENADPKL